MIGPFTEGDWSERPDWPFAQNGSVTLFRRRDILQDAISEIEALDYTVLALDCSSVGGFIASLSRGFQWEKKFGYRLQTPNLDAINDGLREPPFGASGRLLIVAEGFDRLAHEDARFAMKFLDLLEYQSRNALLFGKLMLGFVQTNDPKFETAPLGGRRAIWNPREWLISDRDL